MNDNVEAVFGWATNTGSLYDNFLSIARAEQKGSYHVAPAYASALTWLNYTRAVVTMYKQEVQTITLSGADFLQLAHEFAAYYSTHLAEFSVEGLVSLDARLNL